MHENVKPESIPQLVIILADYQYKNSFVADHELNTACLTEIITLSLRQITHKEIINHNVRDQTRTNINITRINMNPIKKYH